MALSNHFFLLSDEPIGTHGDDRLGMDAYRDVITGAVLGTVGPFTIGVYGRWGEGKTSLLRAAESRLRTVVSEAMASPAQRAGEPEFPYIVPVWFNPWQYETEEHPLIPLVAEIERSVVAALADEKRISERFGAQTVKILKGIGLAGLALLRSASVKAKMNLGAPLFVSGETEVALDGKSFVEGLESAWERTQQRPRTPWQALVDQSTYLTIFERLRDVYAGLDDTRPGPEKRIPRIAVFIDDLDRCQADKAFELIEAIKLVLGQRGFIFILALDKAVVDSYILTRIKKQFDEKAEAVTPATRLLAERYLDKIVQLPLYLRDHEHAFESYIGGLIERMKAGGVPEATLDVFRGIGPHLGRATSHGPRALVRRMNTLLVDQRLRPPVRDTDADDVKSLNAARFLGLCLVQRTLLDHFDRATVVEIARDGAFCVAMAECWMAERTASGPGAPNPVAALLDQLDRAREAAPGSLGSSPETKLLERQQAPESEQRSRWRGFLFKLNPYPASKYVLSTDDGVAWLRSGSLRDLVTNFVAAPPVEALRRPSPAAGAATDAFSTAVEALPETPELREQIGMIERAARVSLGLPTESPLNPAAWRSVQELDFVFDPVTDIGAAWLARADTGLKALATLTLSGTQVTDEGVKALARADTGLKALAALNLGKTPVTDAGGAAIEKRFPGIRLFR
ncbi:hypothetical protein BH11PLA1_BH11PLA1_18410 [soil metagenome]